MTQLPAWWEICLTLVKISGVVMTAVFGAYGIAHEYKRDGALTREGKIAIAGTFLSAVLSLSAQAIESVHQFRSERQQATAYAKELENWNTVLSDVRRGLYPVNDFRVEVRVQLSLSRSPLRTYAERLRREISTREDRYDNSGFYKASSPEGFGGWITSESTVYPRPDKEPEASRAISGLNMYFFFSKETIYRQFFEPLNDSEGWFHAEIAPGSLPVIHFDSRCPDTVELDVELRKLTLHMNERVRYLEDFSNAELLVRPLTWDELEKNLPSDEVSIKRLVLSFGNKQYFLPEGILRPVDISNQHYFEYKLPSDMVSANATLPDTTPQLSRAKSLCPSFGTPW